MAKFINTKYENTVDNLIKGDLKKFNNPYYTFTDKKPNPVDYYSINKQHSTLDEGSGLAWSLTGSESPIKYNIVRNFLLYGLERISTQYNNDEWGLEVSSIEGEAYILPNTIEPTPGDFFAINYIKETLLFKVTDVTKDTLDTGANFYKIQYKIDQTDFDVIKSDHIIEEYKMIVNNVGTQFKSIIRDTTYDLIVELETATATLKKYFNALFFKDRVQTFIYTYASANFYDPSMIEFIKRNKILANTEDYVFVDHACYIPPTFAIDYDKSFFRGLEEKDIDKFVGDDVFLAEQVQDVNSLLSTQYDPYYKIVHTPGRYMSAEKFPLLDQEFLHKLSVAARYTETEDNQYYNIIIDYFDNRNIDAAAVAAIKNIDLQDNRKIFYTIPMLIYCIEASIQNMLS